MLFSVPFIFITFYIFRGVSNPRVTISCYHGSQKLNQNGQEARYKVVQYPNSDSYSSNKASLYPDLMLPCNRLLLQFSTAATEGLVVHLDGFSAKFFVSPNIGVFVFSTSFIHYSIILTASLAFFLP